MFFPVHAMLGLGSRATIASSAAVSYRDTASLSGIQCSFLKSSSKRNSERARMKHPITIPSSSSVTANQDVAYLHHLYDVTSKLNKSTHLSRPVVLTLRSLRRPFTTSWLCWSQSNFVLLLSSSALTLSSAQISGVGPSVAAPASTSPCRMSWPAGAAAA